MRLLTSVSDGVQNYYAAHKKYIILTTLISCVLVMLSILSIGMFASSQSKALKLKQEQQQHLIETIIQETKHRRTTEKEALQSAIKLLDTHLLESHSRLKLINQAIHVTPQREHKERLLMVHKDALAAEAGRMDNDGPQNQRDASLSLSASSVQNTKAARKFVAEFIHKLKIKTLVDAGCGEANWQTHIGGFDQILYLGLDIVPGVVNRNTKRFSNLPNVKFLTSDVSWSPLPLQNADLVLFRNAAEHDSVENVLRAFINFEVSRAEYLITTWRDHPSVLEDDEVNSYTSSSYTLKNKIDVFMPPFNFSRPIAWMRDHASVVGERKLIGLWKLPVLLHGPGESFSISKEVWDRANHEIIHEDV